MATLTFNKENNLKNQNPLSTSQANHFLCSLKPNIKAPPHFLTS